MDNIIILQPMYTCNRTMLDELSKHFGEQLKENGVMVLPPDIKLLHVGDPSDISDGSDNKPTVRVVPL